MWSILLYTVAFKSLSQTFEDISSEKLANLFFYVTLSIVILGIILTLLKGRTILSTSSRHEWKLDESEKLALGILFAVYLGLALYPRIIFS
jgi:glycopeptide antibiotics resistance protein